MTETQILARSLTPGTRFAFEGRAYTVFSRITRPDLFPGRAIGLTEEGPGYDFALSDRIELA